MLSSMTGYAYEEKLSGDAVVSVEIKSVNSRFLDLSVSLPPYLAQLEPYFRNSVSEKVLRGKVDLNIRVRELNSAAEISADTGLARSYMEAARKVAAAAGAGAEEISIQFILSQPGVLTVNRSYDMDRYRDMIEPVFDVAFSRFMSDRIREGGNLRDDLIAKLGRLEECAGFFREWQPRMEDTFRDQIRRRFDELLGDDADENRIMTETAAMLVKYTINEEIVRLFSHISAMRSELEEGHAPGKRIDFICQEMNREINTIGSKNQSAEVGAMVIAAKDALENIREQARNLE